MGRINRPPLVLGAVLSAMLVVGVALVAAVLIRGDWFAGDDEVPADATGIAIQAGALPASASPISRTSPSIPRIDRIYRTAVALTDGAPETARYRAAIEARDNGDTALAVRLFQRTIDADGVLVPMAQLRKGQVQVDHGDLEAAAITFRTVIDSAALPISLHTVALTEAAANLVELERGEEAVALLTEANETPGLSSAQQASMRWESARIRRALDDPAWIEDAMAVLTIAPTLPVAFDALDALAEAEIEPPVMDAAFVNYRARRDDEAARLFELALEGGELSAIEQARAHFYLGALAERFQEREEAIEAYARSLEAAPDGPLAADARYWRGRVYEELDEPAAAAAEYDLLVQDFPDSTFAADGRLRGALALGFAGDTEAATARLEDIAATATPHRAAEAARWHTVFRTQFGAETATGLDPAEFHPAVLWALLNDETPSPLPDEAHQESAGAYAPLTDDEVAEIEAWLLDLHGPRIASATPVLEDGRTRLGFALIEAGELTVGRSLLFQTAAAYGQEPYELLDLGIEVHRQEIHDVAVNVANRLLLPVTAHARVEAPRPLLRLHYPNPYADAIDSAAAEFSVPPLLLKAVVLQESTFNPHAVSPAGAAGLGQVMPGTAEEIAERLGEPWDPDRIHDPVTSLRYGAYYLGTQLSAFDGDILAALSAYNAGPGSASRWLSNQPFEGPDGYLYAIDFTETRAYMEHVLENYAWYRYLYTEAPAPAIR